MAETMCVGLSVGSRCAVDDKLPSHLNASGRFGSHCSSSSMRNSESISSGSLSTRKFADHHKSCLQMRKSSFWAVDVLGGLTGRQGNRNAAQRSYQFKVYAASAEGRASIESHDETDRSIFDVSDPWSDYGGTDSAWEVLKNDVLYLDYRARRDVLAMKSVHDKVVDIFNPVRRDQNSVIEMKNQLEELKMELESAHAQVHASEARVEHTLKKLEHLSSVVDSSHAATGTITRAPPKQTASRKDRRLSVTGPTPQYPPQLMNFWFPIAFSKDLDDKTMVPFDCFEISWVLFRGADNRPGCVRDACAHRSCPLSLGTIVDGRVQCPYHGWEFNASGHCEKMPSTKLTPVKVQNLPCVEYDGLIWVWPGSETPNDDFPDLKPPKNYTIHAELVLELPVEHGLLVENLLDLAHAPFTHTTTFAKGWSVPDLVRFETLTARALTGHWDPYPISMEFRPPCMVLSSIGLSKPGQLEGRKVADCPRHLFQMHACVPSTRGRTRLLYRMGLDFAHWLQFVPMIDRLWTKLANQVLDEDLRLVLGQQERMARGANVWNHPVIYDTLGVKYRRWRDEVCGEPGGEE